MVMNVLIACEFSGIVRDAFLVKGHDVTTVDLLPNENPSIFSKHWQMDVSWFLRQEWDLVIAHPPCQYLSNSGVRWLYNDDGTRNEERWELMRKGAEFFVKCLTANAPMIAVENPVMHKHACEIVGRRQDFTIQPWQFGHGETKRTCFWTRNLPPLKPTNIVDGREPRSHYETPGPDRWKRRSRTLPGIAAAMADQWG